VLEAPFNITVFIETPKEILMIHQQDAQFRHIEVNVRHTKNPKPSWTGESVGHWEADTFIVDTIGLQKGTFVDNYHTAHTAMLHVVEHFQLIDSGKTLQDALRIEDLRASPCQGRPSSNGSGPIAGRSWKSAARKIISASTIMR
jgi:hypothetical protein